MGGKIEIALQNPADYLHRRFSKGDYHGYFAIGPKCADPTEGWKENEADADWDDLKSKKKSNRIKDFLDHRYPDQKRSVPTRAAKTRATGNSTRVTRSTRASAAAVANEEEGNEEDDFPPLADDDSYEDEENNDEDQEHAEAASGGSNGEDVEEEHLSLDAGTNSGQGDGPPSVVIITSDDDTDADAGLDALEAGLVGQEQEQQVETGQGQNLLGATHLLVGLVKDLKEKFAHLLAIVKANLLGQKRLEQQIQDLTARIQALEQQAEEGA